jgi:hypothetical protein
MSQRLATSEQTLKKIREIPNEEMRMWMEEAQQVAVSGCHLMQVAVAPGPGFLNDHRLGPTFCRSPLP